MSAGAADHDLVVIGAGSGGVRAARIAAGHGARVAICESVRVGGTCVLRGCIPKKLLVYASAFAGEFEDAAAFGWTVEGTSHDWPRLIAAKDAELDRLHGIYCRLLDDAGVETVHGEARIEGPHAVTVAGRTLRTERILVATGGAPTVPDLPGAELGITSDGALALPERPDRVAIVGGGYIAVEFAGIFRGLGTEVTLAYRGEQVLRGFDRDVRDAVAEEMRGHGIDVRTGTSPAAVERHDGGLVLRDGDGGAFPCDQVLFATGRRPNTAGIGLGEAGVELTASGAVRVDDSLRSSVPSIYAVGDVTDRVNLTPVATAEGHALADTLFGGNERRIALDNVPSAVFCQPPAATVGLSEEAAREAGREVEVFRTSFRPLRHTLTGRETRAMMKLVVDRRDGSILGAHMVGEDAPEIMQMVAVARGAGATKADFDATLGIHPTTAEEFVTLRTPAGGADGG